MHGVHVLRRVDHDVDEYEFVFHGESFGHLFVEVFEFVDEDADVAVGLCQLGKVGQ